MVFWFSDKLTGWRLAWWRYDNLAYLHFCEKWCCVGLVNYVLVSLCRSVFVLKWLCVEVSLRQSGVVSKCLRVEVALCRVMKCCDMKCRVMK